VLGLKAVREVGDENEDYNGLYSHCKKQYQKTDEGQSILDPIQDTVAIVSINTLGYAKAVV
jgi:hypothetical protein